MLRVAATVLFLVFASVAMADTPQKQKPENRIPGPMVLPLARPGGETLPAGLFALMNHFSVAHYTPYKHSSPHTMRVKTPAGEMKVGPKSAEQFVSVFKIRYGITDRWEFSTATPFVDLQLKNHNAHGAWKGGLGDTTLMLRYGLKKRTENSPFSVALDAGVTLPTGEVGDKDKYLATNAFSVLFGAGVSWVDHNQRVDLDGRYAAYAEGAHGIRPGDFTLFHAHYAWALSRNFDIGAEAYYRIEQQSYVHGRGRGDGFSEAYAGPKIQIKIPELAYLMVGAAALFPVHRNYDAMRLSTDTRWEFSVLVAF
ncbi:MAG: transporter [Desulfovibrionaceae bacterium]|nr:transporter [Desulfovibrionaceae bacterium]